MNGTAIRSVAEPATTDRAAQIAQLRGKIAALGGEEAVPVFESAGALLSGSGYIPGGIPRRAVTQVEDSPLLVAELLGQITKAGGMCAVVGWPELSYAGLPAKQLSNIVAIPEPGVNDLQVAGVLAEGCDAVVLRNRTRMVLTPARARPLLARVRKGEAALLCVNVEVPSPALRIAGEVAQIYGVAQGRGCIDAIDLTVRTERKGHAATKRVLRLDEQPRTPNLQVVG